MAGDLRGFAAAAILAASLAAGTPVSLRDTLTGIDHRNIELVITAVLHAWGQRPEPQIP